MRPRAQGIYPRTRMIKIRAGHWAVSSAADFLSGVEFWTSQWPDCTCSHLVWLPQGRGIKDEKRDWRQTRGSCCNFLKICWWEPKLVLNVTSSGVWWRQYTAWSFFWQMEGRDCPSCLPSLLFSSTIMISYTSTMLNKCWMSEWGVGESLRDFQCPWCLGLTDGTFIRARRGGRGTAWVCWRWRVLEHIV